MLDPRERHRLPRPRHLLRSRRGGRAARSLEHNLAVGNETIETSVEGGQVFSFGPDHIHRLTGAVHGSVSVHAYSPPLWRMGQYSVGADGRLRRQSVSYADELRPID